MSGGSGAPAPARARTRVLRWQGIIPLALALVLLALGWMLFAEHFIRDTITEAGTKALGAQLDIADLDLHPLDGTVELRGVALADPFDRTRNLFEIRLVRVELETEPLLEKKIVIRNFSIADVATGTKRATPATVVAERGFAALAMAEMTKFAGQFKVPLLSLVPIDTLKALILDPAQLKSVQTAIAVAQHADSVKGAIETQYAQLRLQETLDSSRALMSRLQGTNVRTLGVDGARRAIEDVRRTSARVDSAKRRVDALTLTARHGLDSLQAGVGAIDAARRDDYAFARGLLKLPSFEGPDLGSAVFGRVTIDRFQKALYWSALAKQYAPPGLLPKEDPGPKRLRRSGTTVHFVEPKSFPRFWLQRASANVAVTGSSLAGAYAFAARDLTTDPAIVGRPAVFALRRSAKGTDVDSVRVSGSLDHTRALIREKVTAQAAGVALPTIPIPGLPYSMAWGRGSSQLRIDLNGEQLSGHWHVTSPKVTWQVDSANARTLNSMETLVGRVLTGVNTLELTAEITGSLEKPQLAIQSNLDRQLAAQLRAVAGQELAKAEAKARAQVDRIVEEKSAPVKARVAEMRSDAEKRIADARAKLDEEKRKLDERLKALTGGAIGLPRVPGLQD